MTNIYSWTIQPKPFDLDDLNQLVYNYVEQNTPMSDINKYAIYILSKGRPGLVKTTHTIQNLNYKLVVEPQDYDEYCNVYTSDKVIQMDKNDQGIACVRNFIKQYSRGRGEEKHWQLDDDIEKFLVRKQTASKNVTADPLLCISIVEYCMDMFSNVAISGICSSAYAFSKRYAVQHNRLAYQCILVDNSVDIEWTTKITEDWAYTLSVLEAGYCTLAFHHIMQQSPSTMTRPGGNLFAYVNNSRKTSYEEFIHQWPGRFRLKEYPNSSKRWRLQHSRRFFEDYKQFPILKQY
jgi:hypothetical protein